MAPTPLIFAGKVYDSDGTTALEGAKVWIYNKTLEESKNANDTKFVELTTNSAGEYMANLGNFDDSWSIGDVIYYSAFYEDKAWIGSYTLTGDPVSNKNLTLKNLEPQIAVIKLLQMKLTDPNLDNRETNEKWIVPKYSREELIKDKYPIITVTDTNERSVDAGITSNGAEERTVTLLITLYIWAKSGDSQKFTISGGSYEGTKLRDYYAREISEALRSEFLQKPAYNINAIVNKFYAYEKNKMETMDFNDEDDYGIMKKEIEIELTTINQ